MELFQRNVCPRSRVYGSLRGVSIELAKSDKGQKATSCSAEPMSVRFASDRGSCVVLGNGGRCAVSRFKSQEGEPRWRL